MWYDDNYFDLITPKVIDLILCQLPSSSVHKFSLDSSDSNSMFLYFLSFPGVIFVRPCQFLKFHYFLMKLQLYIPLLSTSWEVASLPGIAPAKQALLESGLSPLFLIIQLATWLRLVRLLLDENFEYFDIFNISMTFLHERSSRNFKYNLVAADRNEIFCFKNRNILIFLTTSWCSLGRVHHFDKISIFVRNCAGLLLPRPDQFLLLTSSQVQ